MFLKIVPDVVKVEKTYWYKTSDQIKGHSQIRVGSIVRINFNGRRVRGWVIEISPELPDQPEELDPFKIKSIIEYVSDGPPARMMSFAENLARHYLSSQVTFLRMCSPTKIITGLNYNNHSLEIKNQKVKYLVSPRANRRQTILDHIAKDGSTIIVSPDSHNKLTTWLQTSNFDAINYSDESKENQNYISCSKGNKVVVGGRAALFSPLSDCTSIIVLDDAYEQLLDERSPKWHALDVAKIASDLWQIPLTLITSVPTASSFDFDAVDLRDKKNIWPQIKIENLNVKDPVLGIFTKTIVSSIDQASKKGLDSAIIINNIAAARLLICKSCDTIATCENCDHAVIQDDTNENPFVCPICSVARPIICLNCKATSFKKLRRGLQSIAKEAQGIFPANRILEISKATQIDVGGSGAKIFVATEALFHRPELVKELGCVVFIDIDSVLFRPNMNAFEQTLVLVNRAVRAIKRSELAHPIVLATRAPENLLIDDMKKMDFVSNYDRELELRKNLKLAPFFATVKFKANTKAVELFVSQVKKDIISAAVKGEDGTEVYLSAENHEELANKAFDQFRSLAANNRCKFSVDVYD